MNAIHVLNFISMQEHIIQSMNAMLYSAKPCFEDHSFGRFWGP